MKIREHGSAQFSALALSQFAGKKNGIVCKRSYLKGFIRVCSAYKDHLFLSRTVSDLIRQDMGHIPRHPVGDITQAVRPSLRFLCASGNKRKSKQNTDYPDSVKNELFTHALYLTGCPSPSLCRVPVPLSYRMGAKKPAPTPSSCLSPYHTAL